MNELALFIGAGGGALSAQLLGWRTVCAVEINPYCREILLRRQEEGHLKPFPIWDDITTFDGKPWCGKVDIITAGFPCPAFSRAGKGGGFKQDPLFYEAVRIVRETEPYGILWENVEGFTRWKEDLRNEVEALGYEWYDAILNPLDFGVQQNRPRYFNGCLRRGLLFNTQHIRGVQRDESKGVQRVQPVLKDTKGGRAPAIRTKDEWRDIFVNTGTRRKVNGVAHRMDRLRAIGNGWVPSVGKVAGGLLSR